MASLDSARGVPSLLRSLNHVSRVCTDVEATAAFYRDLLGFVPVRRPSFNFEGAWLYSPHCSVGLHLIKGTPVSRSSSIDPKADHLSFVCTSLAEVEELLVHRRVPHVKQSVIEEDGVRVTQIFFHDPENNMIEICNCDELPVEVLADMGCAACQAKVSPQASDWEHEAPISWEGVPLGSMHSPGQGVALHHPDDDSMSDHSSHSASAREHARMELFSSNSGCEATCCERTLCDMACMSLGQAV